MRLNALQVFAGLALASAVAGGASAEGRGIGSPATRIESFLAEDAGTAVRSYFDVGAVRGPTGGRVELRVMSVANIDNGETARAVVVRLLTPERQEATTYIDSGELAVLIEDLDFLTSFDPAGRPFEFSAAEVRTRGAFVLRRVPVPEGLAWTAQVGRSPARSVSLTRAGVTELRELLSHATAAMAAMP